MTISIVGFTSDDKVPGFYGETVFGQGRISIGELPVFLLLLGNKTSAGTATADTVVYDVLSEDDADTLFGAGSELARMCGAALLVDGVNLKAIAVTEASGTAASATIAVGGTWSTGGQVTIYLDNEPHVASVLSGDSTSDVATSIANAFKARPRASSTASASSAVVTTTCKNKGPRGNARLLRADLSRAPAGLTIALAGGTALTGGVTPFSGGATADDVTAALATMVSAQYDYIVQAEADATNLALLKTHCASQAGPLVGFLEHYGIGATGTLSAAVSLAQTTCNDARGSVAWSLYNETVPAEIAACYFAHRASTEGENPNPNYDALEIEAATPQSQPADRPSHATLKSALNQGVTPLVTTTDGRVVVSRAIVTRSLNGSSPDYRCLDVGDAKVPDRVRQECAALWGEFVQQNPYVGPEPSTDDRTPRSGVAYPSLWASSIMSEVLLPAEAANWIEDPTENPPVVEYDRSAKRLMSAVPVVVRALNHQVGVSVRQQAA